MDKATFFLSSAIGFKSCFAKGPHQTISMNDDKMGCTNFPVHLLKIHHSICHSYSKGNTLPIILTDLTLTARFTQLANVILDRAFCGKLHHAQRGHLLQVYQASQNTRRW